MIEDPILRAEELTELDGGMRKNVQTHADDERHNQMEVLYALAGIMLIATYNGIHSRIPDGFPSLEEPLFLEEWEALEAERERFIEDRGFSPEVAALLIQERFAGDVASFLMGEHLDYGWQIAESWELDQVLAAGWQKRLTDWMCDGDENPRQLAVLTERQDTIREFTEDLMVRGGSRAAAFKFIAGEWEASAKILAFFWPKIEQIVAVLSWGIPVERTELESLLYDVANRRFTLEPDET